MTACRSSGCGSRVTGDGHRPCALGSGRSARRSSRGSGRRRRGERLGTQQPGGAGEPAAQRLARGPVLGVDGLRCTTARVVVDQAELDELGAPGLGAGVGSGPSTAPWSTAYW